MEEHSSLLEQVAIEPEAVDSETLESVETLGDELAREVREGRKVGTVFTVGGAESVRGVYQPMILDPSYEHVTVLSRMK